MDDDLMDKRETLAPAQSSEIRYNQANRGDLIMRVICPHCQSKALITSSNQLSETVKDLYCVCSNTRVCGASFVFTLAYKHDLNPPRHDTVRIAAALINRLPDHERKALQLEVFG